MRSLPVFAASKRGSKRAFSFASHFSENGLSERAASGARVSLINSLPFVVVQTVCTLCGPAGDSARSRRIAATAAAAAAAASAVTGF